MQLMRPLAAATVLALALTGAGPGGASAATPGAPVTPATTSVLISGGAGSQTDPHISGTVVTYTNLSGISSEIRHHDLATGTDQAIPNLDNRDSLSDVQGSTVVYRRVHTDGTTTSRSIMAFNPATPATPPVELAPDGISRRASPVVGGSTVAWMEFVAGSSTASELVAYDLVTGQLTRLTDDVTLSNRDPGVSTDGSIITWAKCRTDGIACDAWVTSKHADGTWGTPRQLTDSTGEDILPDTNGQVVSFATNMTGDWDIAWENVDGTDEHILTMPGIQTNPSMSGSLISFEQELEGSTNADLFAYDLTTGTLYRVTDTPDIDDTLNDVSVAADGTVRVVAARPDGITPGHNDVHAFTFRLQTTVAPSYEVCSLFDQSKSRRLGSVVPIRIQLCDADGRNLSSPSLVVSASGLTKTDGSAASAVVEDAGNANPDSAFRYDASLDGYIYNLSTRGLSRGTWDLKFTVSGDTRTYHVAFDLR